MLGKGGRVEDDKVVLVSDMFQILNGIGRDSIVLIILAEVESHILVGQLHCAL